MQTQCVMWGRIKLKLFVHAWQYHRIIVHSPLLHSCMDFACYGHGEGVRNDVIAKSAPLDNRASFN